ncbi:MULTISPECIES: zinc-dependent alcohol dehydrogenase family protein [Fischerella]|uniref:NAD(P)-dependent alcohol dehydrogenase n=1 Tax=Fischerella muscicola CCMEE 5323 TaxID=2019572 RepID=A0A2N6K6P3_FISMU|nr:MULTISPECIES: NAD(P)-dependent alcohol dehydrogenase [Fischerella]MBD2433909.1 NAD(P)-dependent alcohol dehydrogenase [Fischerella sp. FACHB-380]PLZ92651.1 NAD(P)-dependent alcohol dehydrogenase [Fischerella muscicola CCMEE 5323]
MKAIELCDGFGIENLQLVELPKPNPTRGEILVKMEAVSLNYVDLLVVKGLLDPNLSLPYVPVCDGAGVVEQVGEGITAFQPGDQVVTTFIPDWLNGKPTRQTTDYSTRQGLGKIPGQISEYKCFHPNQLVHSPTHLSSTEGSTLPIAGLTAWNALQYSNLQADETVLLHGTGGVSIFALQFAKARGAQVIITSSSDAKLKRAQQLGADLLINYKTTPDWEAIVNEFTYNNGVDVIVETVGGQNLQRSLNVLRMGGHISIVGLLDGFNTCVNTLTLLHRQATIKGMEVGGKENFETMNQGIETNKIHPVIDKIFPIEQTQKAFEYLEQGCHFGKVVITIS